MVQGLTSTYSHKHAHTKTKYVSLLMQQVCQRECSRVTKARKSTSLSLLVRICAIIVQFDYEHVISGLRKIILCCIRVLIL